MMTTRSLYLASLLCVAIVGCARTDASTIGGVGRVPLAMRPVGDSIWELTYRDSDDESRLRVRPQIAVASDSSPFVATTWTLYAVPSSRPRALLGALAKAHGNPATFSIGTPLDSMRLNVVLLGVNAVRASDGTFVGAGKGSWIAAKLFFADGDGELFLNLNPPAGEAEFVTKDEEYGPVVLHEISRLRIDPARK